MTKQTHRSFTLRVPTDFYLELCEAAQGENIAINQLANRLLRLGLGKHVSLNETLRSMIANHMLGEGAAQ